MPGARGGYWSTRGAQHALPALKPGTDPERFVQVINADDTRLPVHHEQFFLNYAAPTILFHACRMRAVAHRALRAISAWCVAWGGLAMTCLAEPVLRSVHDWTWRR